MFSLTVAFNNTRVELVSGQHVIVDGAISCKAGDRVLLLGANAAGKSTLLMLLYAAASHPTLGGDGELSGHLHTLDWDSVSVTASERFIPAHVFQEPRQNFVCRASADEIMLPLLHESLSADTAISRLSDLIDAADVYKKNLWLRRIDQLSSGEQQRIAVAAALATDPQLLLWDEALARTDDRSAECLAELLDRTFTEGVLIAATHRAPRYHRLMSGRITGTLTVVREGNRISVTQAVGTENGITVGEDTEINFADRPLWQRYISPPEGAVTLFKNGMRLFDGGKKRVVELRDLEFQTRGSNEPLASLKSGNVGEGLTFVIGKNGSGKTLLLKLLSGQIRLNPVFFVGSAIHAVATVSTNQLGSFNSARKRGVSVFLPAEPFRWITEETIEAELMLFHEGAELQRRLDILAEYDLLPSSNPDHISYGQQKLLAFLSLPDRCDLVCLDEPFADLGIQYIEVFEKFASEQIDQSKWLAVLLSHSSDVNLTAATQ